MILSAPAGVLAASLALLAPTAALAPQTVDPALNSKNYSITEVIHNKTSHTLTISGLRIDNGATIEDHPNSVAPGDDLTIRADNHGNGVQMWLTMLTDDGIAISSDANVPKVNHDDFSADVITDDNTSIYGFSNDEQPSGDNARASYTLVNSAPGACKTNRAGCAEKVRRDNNPW